MGDGQPAQPGAEKTAGLVRQQSQAKQRAQVAHAKQLLPTMAAVGGTVASQVSPRPAANR